MESSQILTQVFSDLAQSLPSLITTVICLIVVCLRWKRHPKVSLLAALGLGLVFVHSIVFTVIYAVAPSIYIGRSYSSESIQNIFLVLGLVFNCTRVIALAPLLTAIFVNR